MFVITNIYSNSGTQIEIELVSSEDFLVWLVGFFTTGGSSMLKLFLVWYL